jgi:hypothetical protein
MAQEAFEMALEAFEMEVVTALIKVPVGTPKRKQRVAAQMVPVASAGSSSYKLLAL